MNDIETQASRLPQQPINEEADEDEALLVSNPVLLQVQNEYTEEVIAGDAEEVDMFDPNSGAPETLEMIYCWHRIAVPCMVTIASGQLANLIKLYFASLLNDPVMLSAIGLSTSCLNMILLAVGNGINSGIETLASQAYGAGNLQLCGIYLNRGQMILIAFAIPTTIALTMYSETCLLQFGIDHEVSKQVQTQIRWQIAAKILQCQFDLQKRWLACLRNTKVATYTVLLGTILYTPLCWFFMFYLDQGVIGLGIADSIMWLIIVLTLKIYCSCSAEISVVMQPLDIEAFKGWGQYIKFGLPVAVFLCSFWWATELNIIFSGQIGVNELTSYSLFFQLAFFCATTALGIHQSASVILGNCFGANKVDLAKRFYKIMTTFTIIVSLSIQTCLLTLRYSIAKIFTNDDTIVEMIAAGLQIIGFLFVFESMAQFLTGCTRGMGLQLYTAIGAIIIYWIVGVPLSYYLGVSQKLGVVGLALGMQIAAALMTILNLCIVHFKKDWQDVAIEVGARIAKEAEQVRRAKEMRQKDQ